MGGPVGTLWDHICVIATGVESAVVWLGEGSEKFQSVFHVPCHGDVQKSSGVVPFECYTAV